jgi:hypothetical protein
MVFLTFLKFFLKFREQIPCREAASNALSAPTAALLSPHTCSRCCQLVKEQARRGF